MSAVIKDIREIRVAFVRAALDRLMRRLAAEDYEGLSDAATSLSRYLEWYQDDFDPELREQLAIGTQVLTHATDRLLDVCSADLDEAEPPIPRLQIVFRRPDLTKIAAEKNDHPADEAAG